MATQYTIADVKRFINKRFANSPVNSLQAFCTNECHIRVREEYIRDLHTQGKITDKQLEKLLKGYIRDLQNKFLFN